MRVLVDGIAARQGGLATYVRALVHEWAAAGGDDLLLLAGDDFDIQPRQTLAVARVRTPRPRTVSQPVAQTRAVMHAVHAFQPDALLATVPQVSLLRPGIPEAVVVHDLRHHDLPHQFSALQRARRALSYRLAYRRAGAFIVPSVRTRDDLLRVVQTAGGTRVAVVPHGADHVAAGWSDRKGDVALAFGHTPNKRPTSLVEAWAILIDENGWAPVLHITGCSVEAARTISDRATAMGVGRWVRPLPFLSQAEFDQLRARASLVLFPSNYEGFGLPVLEAMRCGVPVVIAREPALIETAGGHAVVAQAWSPRELSRAARQALEMSVKATAAAQRHASSFTWRTTVERTRAVLAGLLP